MVLQTTPFDHSGILTSVAGGGLEPPTFRLWAWPTANWYHPAIFSTPSRIRTCDLLVRSEVLYPTEPSEHFGRKTGLEPVIAWATIRHSYQLNYNLHICGISWIRTTFLGFSVPRIHHVCQDSINCAEAKGFEPLTFGFGDRRSTNWTILPLRGSRRIRTFGAYWLGTLAECCFRPLNHTSFVLMMQR